MLLVVVTGGKQSQLLVRPTEVQLSFQVQWGLTKFRGEKDDVVVGGCRMWYCHTRLHLGFSAELRIWQVPGSGLIFRRNHPPTESIEKSNKEYRRAQTELSHGDGIPRVSGLCQYGVSRRCLEGLWVVSRKCYLSMSPSINYLGCPPSKISR